MARIRTIKPEFFTSENIVELSPLARLLYIGLWCEADREGRLAWKPKTFKMRYLPMDSCDVDALCDELLSAGLVERYGDGLAYIPAFLKHQHINPREADSSLPVPDASSRVSDAQVGRKEGKEGKEESVANATTFSLTEPTNKPPEKPKAVAPRKKSAAKVTIPEDFAVSARVQDWAKRKGYDQLEEHLDSFRRKCRARGYTYTPDGWDDAFMEAIRQDWAKLRDRSGGNGQGTVGPASRAMKDL